MDSKSHVKLAKRYLILPSSVTEAHLDIHQGEYKKVKSSTLWEKAFAWRLCNIMSNTLIQFFLSYLFFLSVCQFVSLSVHWNILIPGCRQFLKLIVALKLKQKMGVCAPHRERIGSTPWFSRCFLFNIRTIRHFILVNTLIGYGT